MNFRRQRQILTCTLTWQSPRGVSPQIHGSLVTLGEEQGDSPALDSSSSSIPLCLPESMEQLDTSAKFQMTTGGGTKWRVQCHPPPHPGCACPAERDSAATLLPRWTRVLSWFQEASLSSRLRPPDSSLPSPCPRFQGPSPKSPKSAGHLHMGALLPCSLQAFTQKCPIPLRATHLHPLQPQNLKSLLNSVPSLHVQPTNPINTSVAESHCVLPMFKEHCGLLKEQKQGGQEASSSPCLWPQLYT